MTLNVALIGAGAMGANHARTIAASSRSDLVLVVDTDRSRARDLAVANGTNWADSVGDIRRVDAAVVATPAEAHTAIVLDLLARGVPVLVEKPASTDPNEVAAMITAARTAGVPLQAGFVERFNPVVRTALELLDVHGPALHVMTVRHSPPSPRITTSVIHDLLIHDLDLAFRLTGASAAEYHAGTTWSPQTGAAAEIADITGRTDTGAIFTCSASRMDQRKIREIRVVTATALLELDLLRRTMTVYRHVAQSSGLDPAGYQAQTVVDIPFVRQEGEPLALQWDAFCDLVDGAIDPLPVLESIEPPHQIAAALETQTRPVTAFRVA
ncbi:MAG: Gfo/Idh/MocA family oxidoreductase [Acidimicrobiia bacterium]|nr:Gfo/Idh/MocA family oxidoreductase [Acidimicrobiia bacterium]